MTKKKDISGGADLGADQVQQRVDAENKQGFAGVEVDPTPNENYTMQGVIEGAPTPETDPETAKVARDAAGLDPLASSAPNLGEQVTVKDRDGKEHTMSRKSYELNADRYTLVGGKS